MKGKERIITALSVQQPDRVPLYIHGINEAPIIGIGKHIPTASLNPSSFMSCLLYTSPSPRD